MSKKVKKQAWISSVDDLVFYGLDKASPFNLALDPSSNSIDKIETLTLPQLLIDKLGVSILWTVINSGLPRLGGTPVSVQVASACKTAADVRKAANDTVKK